MVDNNHSRMCYAAFNVLKPHYTFSQPTPPLSSSCVFHYIVERGITYLCLADEKNKRRIPFLYLDDAKVC